MLPLHPLVLAATLFAALFAALVLSADDLRVLFVTSHFVLSKKKRPTAVSGCEPLVFPKGRVANLRMITTRFNVLMSNFIFRRR